MAPCHPKSLHALLDVGVRLVGLGNDHVLDHGEQGLADSLDPEQVGGDGLRIVPAHWAPRERQKRFS